MTRTPQCQVPAAVMTILDPCYFILPHLQVHLPSSHNEHRAVPQLHAVSLLTWLIPPGMRPPTLPSPPLNLLLNFQGSGQKPPPPGSTSLIPS